MADITCHEILRQVEHKYLHCETYSDSGTVETKDTKGNPISLPFKTWFVRPNHYRYEWQDWSPARPKSEEFSILNWQGSEARVKHLWNVRAGNRDDTHDLIRAISGATGCSAGAAGVIPALLMSHVGKDSQLILSLIDASFVLEDSPGSGSTFVVDGTLDRTLSRCKLRISSNFSVLKAEIGYGVVLGRQLFSHFLSKTYRSTKKYRFRYSKCPLVLKTHNFLPSRKKSVDLHSDRIDFGEHNDCMNDAAG